MKKIATLSFAAAMIAALAVNAAVGKNDKYQYVTVEDEPLVMNSAFYADSVGEWTGEGFHAGNLYKSVWLTAVTPKNYEMPDSSSFQYTVTDIYGGSMFSSNFKMSLAILFGQLDLSESAKTQCHTRFNVRRGGTYITNLNIYPIDYTTCDTIVVKDEPLLKLLDASVKLGEDLDATACYSTGYPFSMSDLSGNEWAKYTIYAFDGDSSYVATDYTDSVTLRLKDEAHPLMAGVDTMKVTMKQPRPGRYRVVLTSDWPTGNKIYQFTVSDTLRVTTSLDKDVYYLDTDKAAKLSVHAERGFPYVQANEDYPTPTVTLKTDVDNVVDSLVFASDTLAKKALNLDAELSIDLSKITKEYLEQNNDSVRVDFSIDFSGTQMFTKKLMLIVKPGSTGVHDIEQPVAAGKQGIYSIDGIKWNCRKEELPKGIYIIDGKKEVVK